MQLSDMKVDQALRASAGALQKLFAHLYVPYDQATNM